jgi:hypothetical protein
LQQQAIFANSNYTMLVEPATSNYISCSNYINKQSRTMNSQTKVRLISRYQVTNLNGKFSTKEARNGKIELPRRGQRRRRFEEVMYSSGKNFKSIAYWLLLILLQLSFAQATKRSATLNELGEF